MQATTTTVISIDDAVETAFPLKLYTVLDESEKQGFDDVVSWRGNGAFAVHKPKEFEETVMKEYFNQTRYANFARQLHRHGFTRLTMEEPRGESYGHKHLVRGKPDLCRFLIVPSSSSSKPTPRVRSGIRRHARHRRSVSDTPGGALLLRPSGVFATAAGAPRRTAPRWPRDPYRRRTAPEEEDEDPPRRRPTPPDARSAPGGGPLPLDHRVDGGRSSSGRSSDDDGEGDLVRDGSRDRGESCQRRTKKHRGNNSWSPTVNYGQKQRRDSSGSGDSLSPADLDWLSLAFGGERAADGDPDEDDCFDREIIHQILDDETDEVDLR